MPTIKTKKIRVIRYDMGRWRHSYFGYVLYTKFKKRDWITYGEHMTLKPMPAAELKKIKEKIKRLPIDL